MKFITIILSLLILALSIKPCSDGNNAEDQHQDEISANHNHQNDSDDSCPLTCICNCCGMAITYQPIQTFDLVINNQISTEYYLFINQSTDLISFQYLATATIN